MFWKKYLIGFIGVVSVIAIIAMLNAQVAYHKKDAELNLQAAEQVGDEWLKVSKIANENAQSLKQAQAEYKETMKIIVSKYEQEIWAQERAFKLYERIGDVQDDEDGDVSDVLSNTLSGLRDMQAESTNGGEDGVYQTEDTGPEPELKSYAKNSAGAKTE